MPTDLDRLKTHLGYTGARPIDDEAMSFAVDAANAVVVELRPDLGPLDPAPTWPAHIDEAATIQAAAYYGARASVQGLAQFQEAGASYLPRIDPRVRMALGLAEFQPSVVS